MVGRRGGLLARAVFAVALLVALAGSATPVAFAQDEAAGTPVAVEPAAPGDVATEVTPEATVESEVTPEGEVTPEATSEPAASDPGLEATPDGSEPGDATGEVELDTVGEAGNADVVLSVVDLDGASVSGACFDLYEGFLSVYIGEYCDSDDGTSDGTVIIPLADLLNPGRAHYVVPTVLPQGFAGCLGSCDPIFPGDGTASVVIAQFRTVTVFKVDESGDPLAGSCFQLFKSGESPTVCDSEDGSDDGTIAFNDVRPDEPHRTFLLVETTVPAGYSEDDRSYEFPVYDQDVEITVTNYALDVVGTVRIDKVDEDENALVGACFEAFDLDGNNWQAKCDDSGDALNPTADGVTYLGDLPPGTYDVYEQVAPDGYGVRPQPMRVEVVTGEETVIEWVNYPPAYLTVRKVNTSGDLLPGACFVLKSSPDPNSNVTSFCDGEDGANDGINVILDDGDNEGAGTYWIEEDQAPDGYAEPTELVEVTLQPGDNEITIVNKRLVTLTIYKQDENGDPLPGACFALAPYPDFELGDEVCDADDGTDDGTILFEDVIEGEYIWFETVTPAGYVTAFPTYVNLEQDNTIEVLNTLLADAATITVEKVDEHGEPLAGACFELYEGDLDPETGGPGSDVPVQEVCDADDGSDDGVIAFDPVPVANQPLSNMVLVETVAPAGYKGGIIIEVEIGQGENVFEIANEPTDGTEPTPSPTPTATPHDEDDELDDVTTLPTTGAGPGVLSAGGMAVLWLLLMTGLTGGLALRGRRAS